MSTNESNVLQKWTEDKRIIVVEGPDGAGKTTQCKIMADSLNAQGISTVVVRQPNAFRSLIMDEDTTEAEKVMLLLADYDLVIHDFMNLSAKVMILDRTPYVSYHIYNKHICEFIDGNDSITKYVNLRFQNAVKPDVIFILNRHSLRPPDETIFEQRQNQENIFVRYNSLNNEIEQQIFFTLFGTVFHQIYGLPESATKEDVAEWLMGYLTELATWETSE